MCEYYHCYGNNHDPMCPNYDDPDKLKQVVVNFLKEFIER